MCANARTPRTHLMMPMALTVAVVPVTVGTSGVALVSALPCTSTMAVEAPR